MGDSLGFADQPGDDVLAEVVAGVGVLGIAAKFVDQEPGLEHVDAHAGQRLVGIVRHGWRVGRLLDEIKDPVRGVDVHDAEARGLRPRHLDAADGDVRALLHVLMQHGLIVHLVDVVAGQHDDEPGHVVLDDVDVLEHGVGGAEIPVLGRDPLAGGQDVEGFVALVAEEVPAPLQVSDQAVGLVLGRHRDPPDARVQGVGQGEIDDPEFAAEEHGGLGAHVGELQQAAAASAREHERQRLPGERGATEFCHWPPPVLGLSRLIPSGGSRSC